MNKNSAIVLLNFFNNSTYPQQWESKKDFYVEMKTKESLPLLIVGQGSDDLKDSFIITASDPLNGLIALRKKLEENRIEKIIIPISSMEFPTLRFLASKVFGDISNLELVPVINEFQNYVYKEMVTEQSERMLPLIPLLDKIPDGDLRKLEAHLKKNPLPGKIWW